MERHIFLNASTSFYRINDNKLTEYTDNNTSNKEMKRIAVIFDIKKTVKKIIDLFKTNSYFGDPCQMKILDWVLT